MTWSIRSIFSDAPYCWRLTGGLVACLMLTVLALVFAESDLAGLLAVAMTLITVVLLIVVAVVTQRGRRRVTLLALVVYVLVPTVLLAHFWEFRDHARWFLLSGAYEAKVLAQPVAANGELKHVVWDGAGFAGQDTDIYLVFDPTNSLAASVGGRPPVLAAGLPCVVDRVTRLESHWYAVAFYTDIFWVHGECT